MMKKFILFIGLLFCATTARAAENLIENMRVASNGTLVDGVFHQIEADPQNYIQWKLQLWFNNDRHLTVGSGNFTFEQVLSYVNAGIGFMSHTFKTTADLEDLRYVRFGLNGKERNSLVELDIKDIQPDTTYTIQWRVLNNTQGEFAWTDMFVTRCGDGYSLALGDENCSRECENKPVSGGHIPPDAARVYEPAICTYDQARQVCDDGYVRRGDACAQLCTAGMQHIKTGNGLQFNLYQVAYSTPALHVKRNDTVCYGVLAPGAAANAININHNSQIFHTEN